MVLALVLLLAACGGTGPENGDATGDADSVQTNGPPAADFEIALYTGAELVGRQETRFSALQALGRPVVLNMWAGLCPPCRLEMPDFQEVSEAHGDDILFFGLDVGPFANLGSSEDGQALVVELGITYPTGTTGDATVVQDYELLGMPTTYFITSDGEVLRRWTGLLTADKLSELVDELLQISGS
jgi:thiol-disulfide isomerase/thioredoxin